MKIRILDNAIRLRLSQSEVLLLAEKGLVRAKTHFGPAKDQIFTYSVQNYSGEQIIAAYEHQEIKVLIPAQTSSIWANSEEISLRSVMNIDQHQELSILVEKDFKCLDPNRPEDESDLFPHPKQDELSC